VHQLKPALQLISYTPQIETAESKFTFYGTNGPYTPQTAEAKFVLYGKNGPPIVFQYFCNAKVLLCNSLGLCNAPSYNMNNPALCDRVSSFFSFSFFLPSSLIQLPGLCSKFPF
jgi:hypothetical protein